MPFGEHERPRLDRRRREHIVGELQERHAVGAHERLEQRPGHRDVAAEQALPQLVRPGVRRRHGIGDEVSGVRERVGGAADRGGDASVGPAARRLGEDGDPQPSARIGLGRPRRDADRIAVVGAGHGEQTGAHVCHVPGHHAFDQHQLTGDLGVLRGQRRRTRHDTRRRLDRGDPVAVRRVAQRPADVVAEAERGHARRRSPLPRRRSTRRRSRPGSTGCGSGRGATSGCARADRSRAGSCGRTGSRRRAHALDDRRVDSARSASASAATPLRRRRSRRRRCSPSP